MADYKDISQIAVSIEASGYADEIIAETGFFKDKADVLTFVAAYMIKNHFEDFNPELYTLSDSGGSNFGSNTLDPERKWYTLISIMYDNTDTPYIYLRALMDKGLKVIRQRMNDDASYTLLSEI